MFKKWFICHLKNIKSHTTLFGFIWMFCFSNEHNKKKNHVDCSVFQMKSSPLSFKICLFIYLNNQKTHLQWAQAVSPFSRKLMSWLPLITPLRNTAWILPEKHMWVHQTNKQQKRISNPLDLHNSRFSLWAVMLTYSISRRIAYEALLHFSLQSSYTSERDSTRCDQAP